MKACTLVADTLTPVRAYAALRQAAGESASFLFESVVGGERWGRYSILGYRPKREFILGEDGAWSGEAPSSDPLGAAAKLFGGRALPPSDASPAVRFASSLFGYFSWEFVRHIAPVKSPGGVKLPIARLMGGASVVVFDNLAQTLTIAAETDAELEETRRDLSRDIALPALQVPNRGSLPPVVDTSIDDEEFMARVRRAQEYIAAGDAFQVVLSRTFRTARGGRDPFAVYRAMRLLNPSPYMYFLDLPPAAGETDRLQIAGASPETMTRCESGKMTVRPLAGTRPRGQNPAEDLRLEKELLADEKERAEHVMLIDLGRNDVGRVAKTGTVALLRKMEVERYSHVMHIVSEVSGEIREDVGPWDVVRSAFPAGTLSGAPKVRAMQIIEELEGAPRGLYGGAVGYIAPSGDLDLAIAIRTLVCRGDSFEVSAGAGVVEASDPKSEADETRNKARGVLSAVASVPPSV